MKLKILNIPPHVTFFMIGWVYYLCSPVFLGTVSYGRDFDIMQIWYPYFDQFARDFGVGLYVAIILIMGFAFLAGSFVSQFLFRINSGIIHTKDFKRYIPTFVTLVTIFCLCAVLVIAISSPPSFSSYSEYQAGLFGFLVSIQSLTTFVAVLASRAGYSRRARWAWLVVFGASLYLLISGVRISMINAVLAWMCHRYLSQKPIPIMLISIVIFAGVIIGMLRVGGSVSPTLFLFYFFAEALFTWISAASVLSEGFLSIKTFEVPLPLLSSVINFVPSFLFPEKAQYLVSLSQNISYSSPLGATSIVATSMGNFGLFLFFVYPFFVGILCGYAYRFSDRSNFHYSYYVSISSVVAMQLFRDGAPIFTKQVLWNFGLVPLILYLIVAILLVVLPVRPAKRG